MHALGRKHDKPFICLAPILYTVVYTPVFTPTCSQHGGPQCVKLYPQNYFGHLDEPHQTARFDSGISYNDGEDKKFFLNS